MARRTDVAARPLSTPVVRYQRPNLSRRRDREHVATSPAPESCPPEKPHLALWMSRTAHFGPAFASRVGKFQS